MRCGGGVARCGRGRMGSCGTVQDDRPGDADQWRGRTGSDRLEGQGKGRGDRGKAVYIRQCYIRQGKLLFGGRG